MVTLYVVGINSTKVRTNKKVLLYRRKQAWNTKRKRGKTKKGTVVPGRIHARSSRIWYTRTGSGCPDSYTSEGGETIKI